MKRPRYFKKGSSSPFFFFKCKQKKRSTEVSTLSLKRSQLYCWSLFSAQQEVLSQTTSLRMQGELGGWALTWEITQCLQGRRSCSALTGTAPPLPVREGLHTLCSKKHVSDHVFAFHQFLRSCLHSLLDSFAGVLPPSQLHFLLLLCLLLLLFYALLSLQVYIFKEAKWQIPTLPFITKYRLLPQQVDCWLWPRKVKSLSRQPVLHWQISGDTNKLVPLCREQQLLPPGHPSPKVPLFCTKPCQNIHKAHHHNNASAAKEETAPSIFALMPSHVFTTSTMLLPENSDVQHVPAVKLRLRQKELHRRGQTPEAGT